MRKILSVAFLFCLTSTIANAEQFQLTHKLICDKAKDIFKIVFEYGEKPVWQGKNQQGFISVLTLNPETQTWSFLMTDGETACVFNEGKGFVVEKSPNTNPQNNSSNDKKANPRALTDAINKYID